MDESTGPTQAQTDIEMVYDSNIPKHSLIHRATNFNKEMSETSKFSIGKPPRYIESSKLKQIPPINIRTKHVILSQTEDETSLPQSERRLDDINS